MSRRLQIYQLWVFFFISFFIWGSFDAIYSSRSRSSDPYTYISIGQAKCSYNGRFDWGLPAMMEQRTPYNSSLGAGGPRSQRGYRARPTMLSMRRLLKFVKHYDILYCAAATYRIIDTTSTKESLSTNNMVDWIRPIISVTS